MKFLGEFSSTDVDRTRKHNARDATDPFFFPVLTVYAIYFATLLAMKLH